MAHLVRTYRRLALVSFLIFCVVWNFVFGAFFPFGQHIVKAAAVTWVGGTTGTWETGSNWSTNAVPTISDDVTISSSTASLVITLSSSQSAVFNTLTIGGDATYAAKLILVGDMAVGGAASGNITIATNGTLEQKNTVTQSIPGTLLVQSGGILTHTANASSHLYEVDISAATITVNAGGIVSSTAKGFAGGTFGNSGSGTGGGVYYSGNSGSGGGYGGNGGHHLGNFGGGVGYCDVTAVTSLGSGGGGGGNATGGAGGGLIRLTASGTATINGTLDASGGNGGDDSSRDGGGGSGGGVYLSADTISGTPQNFSVAGGVSGDANSGGGGGGGCVALFYAATNNIATSTVNGGNGNKRGGSGKMYTKKTGNDGVLYLNNNGSTNGQTPQASSTLTLQSIQLASGAIYVVTSSEALVLKNANPFVASDTGTRIIFGTGATFTPTTTVAFTIASTTLEFSRAATLSNSSTLDVIVANNGTLDLREFGTSTTNGLNLNSLLVQSGGIITHGANSDTYSHVINIATVSTTIASGATVTAAGKGFAGGTAANNGKGPGAGSYATAEDGSGAGHGGAGGADANADAGGSAYCSATNPVTFGSGGGGGSDAVGGAGGGYIGLRTTGNLTIAGTLTANGSAGADGGAANRDAGGGAGGAIRLLGVGTVTISGSLTVNGGASGANGPPNGGGGGGGCMYIEYGTLANTGTHSESGGTGSTAGSSGTFNTASLNNAPTTTPIFPAFSTTGNGRVTVTTTVSDADNNTTTLFVHYSINGGVTWASTTLVSVTAASGTPTTSTGKIETITNTSGGNALTFIWNALADVGSLTTTTARIRIFPNDGTVNGTTATSSDFIIDTVPPSVPGNLSVFSTSTTSVTVSFGATSTDAYFREYAIWYNTGSSVSTTAYTAFTSTTDANLATSTLNGATSTTITGLSINTQYSFLINATDSYANSTSSVGTLTVYTLAATPAQPSVGTSTASTLTVIVGSDTNPTSTQYAIYNATADTYLSSSGAATSTVVYQTSSAWGAAVATGLTGNTLYQFKVIARNGDSVTTAFSATSTSIYTLASAPSGISASAGASQITLSWSGNGTSYKVTRLDNSATSGWISTTSYTFSNLACATAYSFTLLARNGDSVETSSVLTSVTTGACGTSVVTITPVVTVTPTLTPSEPAKTEPKLAEPAKVEPVKEEIKKPEPKPEVKKVEQKKVDQPKKSEKSEQPKPEQLKTPKQPVQPSEPIKVGDAGVKVVKEGALLKVTNDRSVQLLLDTNYQKVTIQDESGRVIEQTTVQPTIPWQLSGADGQKCITATFYDEKGQQAKQKVTCVGLDTTPPPPPKVKGVSTKLQLEKKGKTISVRGTSEPNTTIRVRVRLVGGKTSLRKVKTVLREWVVPTVHAATEGYVDVKTDANGNWSYTFPEGFDEGAYEVEVVAEDEAGNVSAPVKTSFGIELDSLDQAVKAVRDVIDNPEVERINEGVVAPAVIGVGVVNMAASGSQLPQVLIYLKYLFGQPLLLLRRKKHKTWGAVYNAFTKQPVDLATVRLVHQEQGNVVRSQVTDTQGRYYLFGEPGSYRLEVDKDGYGGVSDIVKNQTEDGSYARLYHGDTISVNEEKTEINYSIPLEPIGEQKPAEKLIRERTFKVVQHGISLTGVTATGISLIISPELKIVIFFGIHVLFFAVSYKFTHITLPGSFGTVRSGENKKGLHNVVVRIFDSAYNKLVTTVLTDRKGRYAALVGPSVYYVAYEKPGFVSKKSDILDYSSKKTQGQGGMIIRDEVLQPGNANTTLITSIPTEIATPASSAANKFTPVPPSIASEKISVMPIIPDKPNTSAPEIPTKTSTGVTAPQTTPASVDSTSLTADVSGAPAKKDGDRVDNPDDLIAQWKENH